MVGSAHDRSRSFPFDSHLGRSGRGHTLFGNVGGIWSCRIVGESFCPVISDDLGCDCLDTDRGADLGSFADESGDDAGELAFDGDDGLADPGSNPDRDYTSEAGDLVGYALPDYGCNDREVECLIDE